MCKTRRKKHSFKQNSGVTDIGVTSVILVNAKGESVKPIIILKRDGVLNEADIQSQFKDKEGTNLLRFTVAQTDSGWSGVKTLHEYLVNTFDKWLEDNKIERPVLIAMKPGQTIFWLRD